MTELQDHSELKGAQRPRTAARVAAIQALFQIEQNEDRSESVIQQFLVHRFGTTLDNASYEEGYIPEADTQLFCAIVRQGVAERGAILEQLTRTLPETWPVARLDPVLRALFQAALGEVFEANVPAPVLINEYMDIAHGFFSGDEPKLVNGVLDTIMKRLANAPAEESAEKDEKGDSTD
ncbi:transcription antitermination factor NusB [Acetobacter orleanensis]|uniref:N utilization substance protein B n=1 Tax=Acetobacter orleanensis TaxID=104099 RepID=A0A4Y3TL56_9PROT|nr:transcription antitermination factor NusB [Acetobacter orleanensis]KXV63136.1 nitrogen utilization protein B [Acetobacter orleanensis]PCD80238.1 transcription antitermination factor NusB [Acetobacter orleanensis]GAN69027.1 transcription antitermination factor NusB [Acetobacter orleanensis JCM 7639]GBR30374.1 transcription antitermination factor NusB [Acetobacter orleanensis NRIC 0473]GEB81565.1 N utilization substance protein B [Acetobacter orleanensis]